MKKLIIFFVIMAFLAASVLAGTVSRNIPSRIEPGKTLTVTLTISGATAGKLFALEDVIASGLKIKEWTVTGSQEPKESITIREKDNRFGWSFTPTGASATVEYKIDLPNNPSTYTFGKMVWFDPSGQGAESSQPTLTVAPIKCGDGICEGNENSDNCVPDCPKAAPAPAQQPVQQPSAKQQQTAASGMSTTTIAWIVVGLIVVVAAIGYFVWQKKKSE